MSYIDDEIYKNWKFLKWTKFYIEKVKNDWYSRSDIRKIPSILIYKWIKNDEIDYDINPKWTKDYNISFEQKEEIEKYIYEIYKKNISNNENIEWYFWISWNFKIQSEKSEKIAEEIYNLLFKYIK